MLIAATIVCSYQSATNGSQQEMTLRQETYYQDWSDAKLRKAITESKRPDLVTMFNRVLASRTKAKVDHALGQGSRMLLSQARIAYRGQPEAHKQVDTITKRLRQTLMRQAKAADRGDHVRAYHFEIVIRDQHARIERLASLHYAKPGVPIIRGYGPKPTVLAEPTQRTRGKHTPAQGLQSKPLGALKLVKGRWTRTSKPVLPDVILVDLESTDVWGAYCPLHNKEPSFALIYHSPIPFRGEKPDKEQLSKARIEVMRHIDHCDYLGRCLNVVWC